MLHDVKEAQQHLLSYFKTQTEQCNCWNTQDDSGNKKSKQILLKGNVRIELGGKLPVDIRANVKVVQEMQA